jgi:hypothetical protein
MTVMDDTSRNRCNDFWIYNYNDIIGFKVFRSLCNAVLFSHSNMQLLLCLLNKNTPPQKNKKPHLSRFSFAIMCSTIDRYRSYCKNSTLPVSSSVYFTCPCQWPLWNCLVLNDVLCTHMFSGAWRISLSPFVYKKMPRVCKYIQSLTRVQSV